MHSHLTAPEFRPSNRQVRWAQFNFGNNTFEGQDEVNSTTPVFQLEEVARVKLVCGGSLSLATLLSIEQPPDGKCRLSDSENLLP